MMEVIGMNGLMVGAILLAGVVLGLLLGRRTSAARTRARQLETQLESLQQDHERAQTEIQAGREELESAQAEIRTGKDALERAQTEIREGQEELQRTREGLEAYRGKVADHFAGTSERLRELTFQYRAIYNHLAEGAVDLCPDGFEKLEGGLGLDALPEESEAPESEAH
jgi:uncharacterized membrane-anchored protein YhcB (DUF1043 family)